MKSLRSVFTLFQVKSSLPQKATVLTFSLRLSVLPTVEVHQLLSFRLLALLLQRPLVSCLTVRSGFGTLRTFGYFNPAFLILLLLFGLLLLSLSFLGENDRVRTKIPSPWVDPCLIVCIWCVSILQLWGLVWNHIIMHCDRKSKPALCCLSVFVVICV